MINLTNQKINHLHVFGLAGLTKAGQAKWLCRCDCGVFKIVRSDDIRRERVISCGCDKARRIGKLNRSHGATLNRKPTTEYVAFVNAKARCQNPKNKKYVTYGGRGIEFRFKTFEAFLAALGPRPSYEYSVDRIDFNGHYEHGNVRWSTFKQQSRNRRTNKLIQINNQIKCQSEWCEIFAIKPETYHKRKEAGWCDICALTKPLRVSQCEHTEAR